MSCKYLDMLCNSAFKYRIAGYFRGVFIFACFVTLCDFELSDLDLQFVNKIVVCVLVSINLTTYLW